jgi:hypothetical protein
VRAFDELRADSAAEVAAWWPEFWQWAIERPEGDSYVEAQLAPLVGRGVEQVRRRARGGRRADDETRVMVARALHHLRVTQVPFPATVDAPPLAIVPPSALAIGGQRFAKGGAGVRQVIEVAAPTFEPSPASTARVAIAVNAARAVAANVRGAPGGRRQRTAEADALVAYADELEPRLAGVTRPWLEVVIPHLAVEPAPQPPPIPRRIPVQLRR